MAAGRQAVPMHPAPDESQKAAAFRLSAEPPFNALSGAAATLRRRLKVTGASRVTVRAKGTIVGAGGVTLTILPILADGTTDDNTGTASGFDDLGAALAALTALVDGVENARTLQISGSDFVDIQVVAGGATTVDFSVAGRFLDVFVQ
jgi:hypothetical protein